MLSSSTSSEAFSQDSRESQDCRDSQDSRDSHVSPTTPEPRRRWAPMYNPFTLMCLLLTVQHTLVIWLICPAMRLMLTAHIWFSTLTILACTVAWMDVGAGNKNLAPIP